MLRSWEPFSGWVSNDFLFRGSLKHADVKSIVRGILYLVVELRCVSGAFRGCLTVVKWRCITGLFTRLQEQLGN